MDETQVIPVEEVTETIVEEATVAPETAVEVPSEPVAEAVAEVVEPEAA